MIATWVADYGGLINIVLDPLMHVATEPKVRAMVIHLVVHVATISTVDAAIAVFVLDTLTAWVVMCNHNWLHSVESGLDCLLKHPTAHH